MKRLAVVLLVLFANSCSSGEDVVSVSSPETSDSAVAESTEPVSSSTAPTTVSVSPETEPLQDALPAEGAFYFADVDGLSAGERLEFIPDEFAQAFILNEVGEWIGIGRANERWTGFIPEFSTDIDRSSGSSPIAFSLSGYPATSYVYECSDGREARVDHFVRELEEYQNLWARDSFLGDAIVGDLPNEVTFYEVGDRDDYLAGESAAHWGYLRPTGEGGRFAGAEYVHRRFGVPSEEDVETAVLRYGFYQYFSFVDGGGVNVEVLVSAASYDFTQDFQELDDPLPTITDKSTDPFELVDHEMVQARFDCGREAAELIAPVVAALDHSAE